MREVGVRELKASLSDMFRLAARGERVRVTVHGRPVADIVPPGAAPGDDRLRALVTEGRRGTDPTATGACAAPSPDAKTGVDLRAR
jgi:prevent-host-death family protein